MPRSCGSSTPASCIAASIGVRNPSSSVLSNLSKIPRSISIQTNSEANGCRWSVSEAMAEERPAFQQMLARQYCPQSSSQRPETCQILKHSFWNMFERGVSRPTMCATCATEVAWWLACQFPGTPHGHSASWRCSSTDLPRAGMTLRKPSVMMLERF